MNATFAASTQGVIADPFGNFYILDNGNNVVRRVDAVFTGVQLGTAGIQTITVTDTIASTITASALVTVVGGPAASLAIVSGNAQSALIYTPYTLPLVVKALDALGNPSAGASITFTAPTSGADAAFSGSAIYTAVTNSLGLVTTPLPVADGVIGTYTIAAATPGAAGVSFIITNTSNVPLGFNLASNPSGFYSLASGSTESATLTLTPVGGFNAPVNVACTGAIPTTTCTLSEAIVPASGNGSASNFTLTVTTTGPVTAQLTRTRGQVLACLIFLSAGVGLRRRKRLPDVVLVVFCCAAIATLNGCSSSNAFTTNTLPGNYTLTVTGTSGSVTNSVTIQCFVAGKP